jgi:hypothetical protein
MAESDINRPHIFVANFIYNLPNFNGSNGFVKTFLGGWEVAGIIQMQSGISLTPQLSATALRDWRAAQAFPAGVTGLGTAVANQRPLRVEGQPCTIEDPNGTRFINPAAFTVVGYKVGETSPKKTTCLGPPLRNVDFSIYKNFTPSWLKNSFLGEQARIQFRLEMYNAFNTPQFRGDTIARQFYGGFVACGNAACSPTNNTITAVTNSAGVPLTQPYNGNFGVSTRTRGGREIQYALKFYF